MAGGTGSVGGNGVDDDFSPRLRGTLTRGFWIHAFGLGAIVYVLFRLEKN